MSSLVALTLTYPFHTGMARVDGVWDAGVRICMVTQQRFLFFFSLFFFSSYSVLHSDCSCALNGNIQETGDSDSSIFLLELLILKPVSVPAQVE